MIEVEITPEMLSTARKQAEQLGVLKNSIRNGKGNLTGYLGQWAVLNTFPAAVSTDTYDYDIKLAGFSFEVKTKLRTVPPKPHYDCSISDYNPNQQADFYLFVSLLNYEKAYLLGFIERKTYFKKAKKWLQGQLDESNRWKASCDCYNLPISELEPPEYLYAYGPSYY